MDRVDRVAAGLLLLHDALQGRVAARPPHVDLYPVALLKRADKRSEISLRDRRVEAERTFRLGGGLELLLPIGSRRGEEGRVRCKGREGPGGQHEPCSPGQSVGPLHLGHPPTRHLGRLSRPARCKPRLLCWPKRRSNEGQRLSSTAERLSRSAGQAPQRAEWRNWPSFEQAQAPYNLGRCSTFRRDCSRSTGRPSATPRSWPIDTRVDCPKSDLQWITRRQATH